MKLSTLVCPTTNNNNNIRKKKLIVVIFYGLLILILWIFYLITNLAQKIKKLNLDSSIL